MILPYDVLIMPPPSELSLCIYFKGNNFLYAVKCGNDVSGIMAMLIGGTQVQGCSKSTQRLSGYFLMSHKKGKEGRLIYFVVTNNFC